MAIRCTILFLFLFLLSGCATGRLFTLVTEPATKEFHHTPVGSKQLVIHSFRVQAPVSGYQISAEWETDPVKAAALEAGITNLYYADRRTLSVFSGLYRQKTLIIYGD